MHASLQLLKGISRNNTVLYVHHLLKTGRRVREKSHIKRRKSRQEAEDRKEAFQRRHRLPSFTLSYSPASHRFVFAVREKLFFPSFFLTLCFFLSFFLDCSLLFLTLQTPASVTCEHEERERRERFLHDFARKDTPSFVISSLRCKASSRRFSPRHSPINSKPTSVILHRNRKTEGDR